MDSREQFLEPIRQYYWNLTQGKAPANVFYWVTQGLADYFYDEYSRFSKIHPTSKEKYSSLDLREFDHVFTHEQIIRILKQKVGNDYAKHAAVFLDMTLDELAYFEKRREDFYNMF